MTAQGKRWIKNGLDRVYFNHVFFRGAKVYVYADENGNARLFAEDRQYMSDFARKVVEEIRGSMLCADSYIQFANQF